MKRFLPVLLMALSAQVPAQADMDEGGASPLALPDGVRLLAEPSYGAHPRQR